MPGHIVLIAYDGSELAQAAVRRAAELFSGARALVVTVWEPGLAAMASVNPGYDLAGLGPATLDPELASEVDQAQQDHATQVAEDGARLASSLGFRAEPHAIPDQLRVADAVVAAATEHGAAVVVIGSHGITGLRSHLLGSTSRQILARCPLPVLVVRGDPA